MGGHRFDTLTKAIAETSRRSLLKAGLGAVLGGALGAVGLGEAEAARVLRAAGVICRKNSDCASGVCGSRDRYGRSRCLCGSPSDCPQSNAGDVCRSATCTDGVCGITVNVGASCDSGDLCTENDLCQANGSCIGTPKNCDDDNVCTSDTCEPDTGTCVHTPISCDDSNACTVDTCDPVSGCVHTPIVCASATCDPGVGCVCASDTDCPSGHLCQHGGCFLLNPGATSQFCFDACGPSNIATLGGQIVCIAPGSGTDVCNTDSGCPVGSACYSGVYCVAPC